MTNLEIGLWSFPLLLLLIFLRLPIGLAMLLCGLGGSWIVFGNVTPVLAKLKNETYSTFSGYSLSIIPLFLLMGQFATLGGMSRALFKAAETWMGHRRGGLLPGFGVLGADLDDVVAAIHRDLAART
ncbi:TRAP transporter large permease subunit, partial [Nitratireductor aquimarinus]